MLDNFRNWIIETVLWAENNLVGKSGREKRAIVIGRLSNALFSIIKLPWYLAWAKTIIANKAIGYLVDLVCEKLDLLSGWDFKGLKLNPYQINELAAVIEAPATVLDVQAVSSFGERLDDLYRKYGISDITPAAAHPSAGEDYQHAAPPPEREDYKLSANLARREIACKCGCGFDQIDPVLVDTFQALRDYIGKPVVVISGCRCKPHNAKVKGAANSGHITGQALDIYVRGINNSQLYERIKEAHRAGLLPHLTYCYPIKKTKASIHIGVDTKSRKSIWG